MRLTEIIRVNGKEYINIKGTRGVYENVERKSAPGSNAIVRLAAYEDTGLEPEEIKLNMDGLDEYHKAEAEGRLVFLPCKVGDTVWSRDVEPWTVVSVEWFSRKVTQLHCKSPVTGRGMTFSVGKRSLGKTVFLSRSEAEAALKGETEDV